MGDNERDDKVPVPSEEPTGDEPTDIDFERLLEIDQQAAAMAEAQTRAALEALVEEAIRMEGQRPPSEECPQDPDTEPTADGEEIPH